MADVIYDNPIAWAHLQLRGGWKNIAFTAGLYGLAVGTLIFITTRIDPDRTQQILAGWVPGLLGLQLLVLVLFGCNTLSAAVKQDLASGMIESHRLMPVGPLTGATGYLMGATSQAVALGVVNFLIGTLILRPAGVEFGRWLAPSLIVAAFAVFLWVVTLFLALVARNAMVWLVLVGMISWTTSGLLLTAFPGMTVLLGPLLGDTVFAMRTRQAQVPWENLVSMGAEAVVGALLLMAAARRYRRGDGLAINVVLALLILVAWVGLSWIGMTRWDDFRPLSGGGVRRRVLEDTPAGAQFIGSVLLAMLLGLAAVGAAAWEDVEWRRHRAIDDPQRRGRPIPPLLAIAAATALVMALAAYGREIVGDASVSDAAGARYRRAMLTSLSVVGAFFVMTGYAMRVFHHVGARPRVLAGALLVLTCAMPLMIDVARRARQEDPAAPTLTGISAASPAGALVLAWDIRRSDADQRPEADLRQAADLRPGLVVQWVWAGLAVAGWYALATRRRPAQVPAVASPSSPPDQQDHGRSPKL